LPFTPIDPDKLKGMIESDIGQKVFRHTNSCDLCQTLQGMVGLLVEKHMAEQEKKEGLK